MAYEDTSAVVPDGQRIRRLRRDRGWSRRVLVREIGRAHERETGLLETISINQLEWIEERDEQVPYDTVCRIASGLDCNPVELLLRGRAAQG